MKTLILATGAIIAAAGCHRGPGPHEGPESTRPLATSAAASLDAMDARIPVPLLPMMANHQKENMREHLRAVQEIVGGIGAKDFDTIARAATKIGYSDQMGQMCNHMGARAPGFAEQALRFHHTADKIAEAARGRDMPGVVTSLSETLATCTGCHAAFKQSVVDETTWASLADPPAARHP